MPDMLVSPKMSVSFRTKACNVLAKKTGPFIAKHLRFLAKKQNVFFGSPVFWRNALLFC